MVTFVYVAEVSRGGAPGSDVGVTVSASPREPLPAFTADHEALSSSVYESYHIDLTTNPEALVADVVKRVLALHKPQVASERASMLVRTKQCVYRVHAIYGELHGGVVIAPP